MLVAASCVGSKQCLGRVLGGTNSTLPRLRVPSQVVFDCCIDNSNKIKLFDCCVVCLVSSFVLLRRLSRCVICVVASFVDLWICGFVDLWICGFVDLWICGFVDLWICGFVDLSMRNFIPSLFL